MLSFWNKTCGQRCTEKMLMHGITSKSTQLKDKMCLVGSIDSRLVYMGSF